jgi:hypothetical protein
VHGLGNVVVGGRDRRPVGRHVGSADGRLDRRVGLLLGGDDLVGHEAVDVGDVRGL